MAGNHLTLHTNDRVVVTTSRGNQEKWFDKETNKWYKLDQFGYEALAETLISRLLEKSNISSDTPFSFAKYRTQEYVLAYSRQIASLSSVEPSLMSSSS